LIDPAGTVFDYSSSWVMLGVRWPGGFLFTVQRVEGKLTSLVLRGERRWLSILRAPSSCCAN